MPGHSIMRRLVRGCADAKGVAATEFALVVPILALITILMSEVGQAAVSAMNMQAAVRASIQYAMNGGSDMTVAQTVGKNAWEDPPADASLTAVQSCKCGAAAATCGTVCADGSPASVFVTATAVATIGGSVVHFIKTTAQTVQVK